MNIIQRTKHTAHLVVTSHSIAKCFICYNLRLPIQKGLETFLQHLQLLLVELCKKKARRGERTKINAVSLQVKIPSTVHNWNPWTGEKRERLPGQPAPRAVAAGQGTLGQADMQADSTKETPALCLVSLRCHRQAARILLCSISYAYAECNGWSSPWQQQQQLIKLSS